MRDLPDDLRDRFEVVRVLGRGGMGAVYEAHDGQLDRRVAIKVMRGAATEVARARFLREARTLSELRHPHVLEVYAFGEAGGDPYLVTELVRGGHLGSLGPEDDPVALMLQAAEGIEAVHQHGLVHRDIKPANLLRDEDGRVVVADFGLVYDPEWTRLTGTRQVVGTVPYMAPEILRLEEPLPASDWYAWGVGLFWMIERRPPIEEERVFDYVRTGTMPGYEFRRIDAGSRLAATLRACMALDPKDRPSTAGQLRDLLEGTGPVPASPSRSGEYLATSVHSREEAPPPRPGRRAAWIGGGLAAAALLVAIGSGTSTSPPGASVAGAGDGAGAAAGAAAGAGAGAAAGAGAGPDTAAAPGAEPPATDPTASGLPPRLVDQLRAEVGAWPPAIEGLDAPLAARRPAPDLFLQARRLWGGPALEAWRRWLGGPAATLDEDARRRLAEVDGDAAALGWPRPFAAASLQPPGAPDPAEVDELLEATGAPRPLSGWRLVAARELAAALALQADLLRRARAPFGVDPALPGEALLVDPRPLLVELAGGDFDDLRDVADEVAETPEGPARFLPWIRPATRRLRGFLFALGRALDEDPAARPGLARWARDQARGVEGLLASELVWIPVAEALGGRLGSPEALDVAMKYQRKLVRARLRLGLAEGLVEDLGELEARARALGASATIANELVDSLQDLVRDRRKARDHEGVDAIHQRFGGLLLELGAEDHDAREALAELARSWAARPLDHRPPPAITRPVLDRLAAHPDELDEEAALALVELGLGG